MMRPFLIAAAAVLSLALPASAAAKATENFTFKHGEANYRTSPASTSGAYTPPAPRAPCPTTGVPCTWEAHDFTIAEDEQNGSVRITVAWGDPGPEGLNDWDLYVYKVLPGDTIDEGNPVASSASGGTSQESALIIGGGNPVPPGKYRIIVDQWSYDTPPAIDWEGFAAFEPYTPTNVRPSADLAAPAQATAGAPVTLDAGRSTDSDGTIVNYAFDLDGDGSFEADTGTTPTREASFPAGRANVSVRVRDDRGGVDYATRTIDVAAAGGPPPPPPAPQDQEPGPDPGEIVIPPPSNEIVLDLNRRQKFGAVFTRGVAGTVECPTACRITARLRISESVARRTGLGKRARTIARRKRTLSGERSSPRVQLKPKRRVLRKLRKLDQIPALVYITVVAEGLPPKKYKRPVSISR